MGTEEGLGLPTNTLFMFAGVGGREQRKEKVRSSADTGLLRSAEL